MSSMDEVLQLLSRVPGLKETVGMDKAMPFVRLAAKDEIILAQGSAHDPLQAPSEIPDESLFFGAMDNTFDALLLVNATIKGVLPLIVRRVTYPNPEALSGKVFVWRVGDCQRWTGAAGIPCLKMTAHSFDNYDICWSASHVDGDFIVYQEMVGQRTDLKPGGLMKRSTSGVVNDRWCPAHFSQSGLSQFTLKEGASA
ncbi:hypothetical protein B0H14DRAFT_3591630 [Mycena olivaceomarginata]|nr:hypothetical protein B0H14DRAFT_3591630 [Mycena olivaceomarginata]